MIGKLWPSGLSWENFKKQAFICVYLSNIFCKKCRTSAQLNGMFTILGRRTAVWQTEIKLARRLPFVYLKPLRLSRIFVIYFPTASIIEWSNSLAIFSFFSLPTFYFVYSLIIEVLNGRLNHSKLLCT